MFIRGGLPRVFAKQLRPKFRFPVSKQSLYPLHSERKDPNKHSFLFTCLFLTYLLIEKGKPVATVNIFSRPFAIVAAIIDVGSLAVDGPENECFAPEHKVVNECGW